MRDDQERRRPAPHRPPDPETVWLDIDTARGVDAAGNEILPVLGGTTHQARDPVRPANNRATPQRPTPDRLR